ncbi:snaclec coagulation factor IX/factor X-binding protein subunit B-like [Montipora capricornis]|uniref:snaclec coagulation factor IX/factor X-binding protein subunit B-like n=1 Tax=Montipora capricornis TaxID=246305 RepID=UPI0035F12F35
MDNNHNSVEIRGKGDHLRTRRAVPACETGWNKYLSSCYKYFNENHRWQDAKDHCSSEFGADLAKITSQDVHNFVYNLGTHQSLDIWIGLRQNAGSSDFVWTDGSQIGNFSFWDTGQPAPIPGHDLCTRMSSRETLTNGRWITGDCADGHSAYVCEKGLTCVLKRLFVRNSFSCKTTQFTGTHIFSMLDLTSLHNPYYDVFVSTFGYKAHR